jgi:sRNA-binding regulator protein Hfq
MENKSQNIQDVYLNTVRKEKTPVTIFSDERSEAHGPAQGFRQVFGHP